MNKQIKSTVISLAVIIVLIAAVLVGAKNGVLTKLVSQMPTLESGEGKSKADNKTKSTEQTKDTSGVPFGGYDVVKLGEEFQLGIKGVKSSPDIKTENSYYKAKVISCKISRECDFDISSIHMGLEDKAQYLDSNNNFKSDFYYVTIETEFTNLNDTVYKELPSTWSLYCLNDDGTYYISRPGMGEPVGGETDNGNMHGNYHFEVGQTKTQKNYYIITDEAATNTRLAIAFGSPVQTSFTGPWVIVHEP